MTIIHPDAIDTITLKHGAHLRPDDGMCLLEAVAYIAGEPHSDHPDCVCPALAAFGRAWNDALDDDARNRILKPFLPRLVGTRSTPDAQDARAFMAADWAVRTFAPAWLRKAGLDGEAQALEQIPEMTSTELCRAAMPTIERARKTAAAAWDAAWDPAGAAAAAAAWDATWAAAGAAAGAAAWAAAGDAAKNAAWAAAWAAAGAAAWDVAWAAAGAAAGAAAWDPAGAAAWAVAGTAAGAAAGTAAGDPAGAAAWDAAWAAAGAAAWDAAWAAAGAAAGDALADTVTELQASAADLFDRMIRHGAA